MDSIKVSIVIPTYNRKESLRKTLESLFNQTYPKDNYEILVCDDYKSTDGTENMMKELMNVSSCELRYFKVKSKYKGPGPARNVGIENARGEIIGFTDDDCIVSPNWIENAIPFFDDKTISGIQGCVLPLSPHSIRNKLFWVRQIIEVTEPNDWYGTCNMFYRKKPLLEIGGFDPRFTIAREDVDLAWGLLDRGYKIFFSKNPLVYHEIRYISLLKYLKSLKQHESLALFIRKHPKYRKKLVLRFIALKTNSYAIFILLATFSYVIGYRMFFNILIVAAIILYLWARVITDFNIKMYPLRILAFIRYFLIDFISLYYTVKGVIRYKCFVI
jgi:glycosyltransferase involved in cell wall biosynthesis